MNKIYRIITVLILFGLWAGCNKRVNNGNDVTLPDSVRIEIPEFGTDYSLDLVSWNIEWFPKLSSTTVRDVAEIIKDLDADIYALQEIADTNAFRDLINSLGDYDGVYSGDVYSSGEYQKTAILYKKNLITLSGVTALFTNDSYSFPRPPLQAYVTAHSNQKTFDFTLIVVHLKASGGAENEARRRSACQKLKNYLDGKIAAGGDKDYIVAGDWNDVLTDPSPENVFQVFLNDTVHYRFLTRKLASDPLNNATYIGGTYRSIIDHILITSDVFPEYDNGTTEVIKVDRFFNKYVSEVSDHRPVGALFPVFSP